MAGIFKLTSGGLMVNYRCQAKCGHCLYHCSPDREPDYITPQMAEKVFKRTKELGLLSMHLSGGEPFIDVDALCEVLQVAQQCGMPIDYIETSASWVTDAQTASNAVKRVADAGVRTLSLSISPYHNEYIALDTMFILAQACSDHGVNASLWIDEFLPDLSVFPTHCTHSRKQYEDYFSKNYWAQLRPRYALNMVGRALITHLGDMPTAPTTRIPHMSRSCAELGGRSHGHIDLYGSYIPPGCPGLALPLWALGEELDPAQFPIYTRLAQDPKALLDYCKQQGFVPNNSYYNRCHLCQDMRLFLYSKFPGKFKELAPASFYEAILAET